MNKSDFLYNLPDELIAQYPIEPRDHSRLLVYDKNTQKIENKHFFDVVDYLNSGDVLVINDTRVIPARVFGHREGFDGAVEILLLKRLSINQWEAITKPAKKLKIGTNVVISPELSANVVGIGEQGIRIIDFVYDGIFEEILDKVGNMPLPPYITQRLEDKERYQTVYSRESGSSAAPTAGLHFTQDLLQKIEGKGVGVARVLLHVGLGTFRPVKEDNILNHVMHQEYCSIGEISAQMINKAKREGKRVVCVGTTSVRVVESLSDSNGILSSGSMDTSIFIYPPYKFKVMDALITNFHLPQSTLLMLVSAFAGRENTLSMYDFAVKEKYRFFSFGDAMLIV